MGIAATLHSVDASIYGAPQIALTVRLSTGAYFTSLDNHQSIDVNLQRYSGEITADRNRHWIRAECGAHISTKIHSVPTGAILTVAEKQLSVALSYIEKAASIAVNLKIGSFTGSISSQSFSSIAVDTKRGGVSEYSDYYSSYFAIGNNIYGISSSGVSILSSGNVSSEIITGYTNFKSVYPVSVTDCYIGMESSCIVDASVAMNNTPGEVVSLASTFGRYGERKANISKGRASNKVALMLGWSGNVNISTITILADAKSRMRPSDETNIRALCANRSVSVVC